MTEQIYKQCPACNGCGFGPLVRAKSKKKGVLCVECFDRFYVPAKVEEVLNPLELTVVAMVKEGLYLMRAIVREEIKDHFDSTHYSGIDR